jgi:hypothetical protein
LLTTKPLTRNLIFLLLKYAKITCSNVEFHIFSGEASRAPRLKGNGQGKGGGKGWRWRERFGGKGGAGKGPKYFTLFYTITILALGF